MDKLETAYENASKVLWWLITIAGITILFLASLSVDIIVATALLHAMGLL